MCKRVHSVDEDGGRAVETDPLGVLTCLDILMPDPEVRALRREHSEAFVGNLPIRAAVKVLQCDVHTATVDLEADYKVKG